MPDDKRARSLVGSLLSQHTQCTQKESFVDAKLKYHHPHDEIADMREVIFEEIREGLPHISTQTH